MSTETNSRYEFREPITDKFTMLINRPGNGPLTDLGETGNVHVRRSQ